MTFPMTVGHSRALVFSVATAACFLGAPFASFARAPDWSGKPYSYVLINQDVRDALREFGRNLNIPVTLSDKIRGQVRGEVRADTAGAFLTRLAEANGLIWYYDGTILHINSSEEFATQIIDLGRANGEVVVDEVARLDLMDDRFSIKSTPNAPALRVSGPPAFIAMVQQVVSTVQPPPQATADDPRVRVFRGGQNNEVVEEIAQSDSTASERNTGKTGNGKRLPTRAGTQPGD
ncbi:type III secretion protein [Phyllobacterium zundukense]|uniref:Type III secretion protein n=1 Tax=Phyllobacterium zundukense TaxID=1867719 RepID=A0ACD4CXL6_9HYPH|nr:type III secretion protein [Phyllobacterium zundukense]UXN58303.1 type III secretion protein [Phyllobacterium zundukense]